MNGSTLPAVAGPPQGELPTFTAEDWESHVSTALALIETGENVLWHLAAVCASVSTRYGEDSIGKFAGEVGYSASRIYDLAATYSCWQSRERSEILSFHHHSVAARAENPERAITEAEDEHLSTRQLSRRIAGKGEEHMEKCQACNGRGRVPKVEVSPMSAVETRER